MSKGENSDFLSKEKYNGNSFEGGILPLDAIQGRQNTFSRSPKFEHAKKDDFSLQPLTMLFEIGVNTFIRKEIVRSFV